MNQQDAIKLIEKGVEVMLHTVWADLGAGSGVFTCALASVLADTDSTIYAIDREIRLSTSTCSTPGVKIITRELDFALEEFPPDQFSGFLLANSFHYIRDQLTLLKKLKAMLKRNGRIIFVEYDTKLSSRWIPYPVDLQSLNLLVVNAGFQPIEKIGEQVSQLSTANLYSAFTIYK